MKVDIYGARPEPELIALILKEVPETAKRVMIKAPARTPAWAKPCQHPNRVIYESNIDETMFVTVISDHVGATPTVHITKS